MNIKRLLIVSHDAGGANLLAFWCKSWQSRIQFTFLVKGPAEPIFRSLGFSKNFVETFPDPDAVDAVVTSTGWQSDLEYQAIVWAKQYDKCVASYLDHWVNYSQRFIRDSEPCFPDEIWVADSVAKEVARQEFSAVGCKVRVVFSRYFNYIKREIHSYPEQPPYLLICLEPIRDGVSYTEVYDRLLVFLSDFAPAGAQVMVRNHPSGEEVGLDKLVDGLAKRFNVQISDRDLWQDLSGASAVFGYQTAVLVYASQVGIATYSYFPKDRLAPLLPHQTIHYI